MDLAPCWVASVAELVCRLLHRITTRALGLTILLVAISPHFTAYSADLASRPNVVLILADDQGYGDLGCHGNSLLRTPRLDQLAAESVRLTQFYVSPVCAPTRASLLTGRYSYRTGVTDTYLGRALLHRDERTLPDVLAAAGYRTGIFGKWHLGDCFPLRPTERGFQQSLVHRGGGIGQPSDPPGGEHYFDTILERNGELLPTRGYCSDVFTDAALEFIDAAGEKPFFCYLAFNAPHDPLEVPEEDAAPYLLAKMRAEDFPSPTGGQPIQGAFDAERTARVYGMVANLDRNIGRVLDRLEARSLAEQTIVVFLTDNGPAFPRYNGGLRGLKGTVYEGGIRVPCFVRWPQRLDPGKRPSPAAHLDLFPTLLAACDVPMPEGIQLDGVNLLPWLEQPVAEAPRRALFVQWHRGDVPQARRACAVREGQWKLVQPQGAGEGPFLATAPWELFDLAADPYETRDLAAEEPQVVERLAAAYDAWFTEVTAAHASDGFAPPRIIVGDRRAPRTVLTRQDWWGAQAGWRADSLGHWEVEVAAEGAYDVAVRFAAGAPQGTVRLAVGALRLEQPLADGATECRFPGVELPAGPAELTASLASEPARGAWQVEVTRSE
jgi:arylsulfatase/arylsulfatase A